MRNRAFGLSILLGLSVLVTACGGSSADVKKVGLVTDVGLFLQGLAAKLASSA